MRFVEAVARRGCCLGDDAVCSSLEKLQLLLFKCVVHRVAFTRTFENWSYTVPTQVESIKYGSRIG